MELYPWQRDCLKAWRDNDFRGIVHVVTGAGKTVMAMAAIRLLQESQPFPIQVRVVVPTASLARQWITAMKRFLPDCSGSGGGSASGSGGEIPGQYGGVRKDSPDRRYMVYVVNSARDVISRHILEGLNQGMGVLLITDECHHYASPENRRIFSYLSAPNLPRERCFSLGLSATPHVEGYESVLVPSLGREIFRYSFSEATAARNVCSFSVFQIALSFTADELQQYDSVSYQLAVLLKCLLKEYPQLTALDRLYFFPYLRHLAADDPESLPAKFLELTRQRSQITYTAQARNACVLDLIAELGLSRQILVFGERIDQADDIYQILCRQYPSRTGRYHSALPPQARRNVLERFQTGELRILVTCRSLDEGVDVPAAAVGIILSGTSTGRQRTQRLGRILRISEGKRTACMYYLYVKESSEESAFLPDTEDDFPACSLSYEMFNHSFCHPAYERLAARVLDLAKDRRLDERQMREMRRCLLEGLIRSDWLLPEEEVAERIRQAEDIREKNYWVCVKEIQKAEKTKVQKQEEEDNE